MWFMCYNITFSVPEHVTVFMAETTTDGYGFGTSIRLFICSGRKKTGLYYFYFSQLMMMKMAKEITQPLPF